MLLRLANVRRRRDRGGHGHVHEDDDWSDTHSEIEAENGDVLDQFLWVGEDDADWLAGGSYLVTRRIRMLIEDWDEVPSSQQEAAWDARRRRVRRWANVRSST